MTEPQGSVYSQFITDELGRELDRRDKMNAQAMSLLTSAGGLLTLSVAAIAFLDGKDFTPNGIAETLFAFALVLFLVAGGLALTASISRSYQVATGDAMIKMIIDHWTGTNTTARNVAAGLNIRTIGSLRTGNDSKALLLIWAAVAQVAAVVVLAIGILRTIGS